MTQRNVQNATVPTCPYELPLLRVLVAATSEMWMMISLNDSRIRCCSGSFLSIWNLPANLAVMGVAALSDESIGSVRATSPYDKRLPAFGEFTDHVWSIVIRQATGSVADVFDIASHVVLDDSGLPIGKLVFLSQKADSLQRQDTSGDEDRALTKLLRLTSREGEVLQLVYNGSTNRAISLKLHVSQKTVEKHRSSAMKKLSVPSFAELIRVLTLAGFNRIDQK